MTPFPLKAASRRLRLQTTYDETAAIEQSRAERRWLIQIPTRTGWIGIHGPHRLTAYVRTRYPNPILDRLREIPGSKQFVHGTGEFRFTFDAAHLALVADILKAKRKRQATPAMLENLALARSTKKSRLSPSVNVA